MRAGCKDEGSARSRERFLPAGAAQHHRRAGPQLLPRSLGGAGPARTTSTSWPTRCSRAAARPRAWPSRARSSTAIARSTPEERRAFLEFLAETMQPDPNGGDAAPPRPISTHPGDTAMSALQARGGKPAPGVLPPPEPGARRHRPDRRHAPRPADRRRRAGAWRASRRDLMHLLASWFNRGFLVLRRIDWQTPAAILEKIIAYEAVHEIQGWDDLRRRLDPADRRCFAFFHPSLIDEPLIFVEVALTRDMPGQHPVGAAARRPRTAASPTSRPRPCSTRSPTARRGCAASRSATS